MSLTMGPTYPSAFTSYPKTYKFIGLTISTEDSRNLINRETYSLLEFLGDIGGLYEFLYLFSYAWVIILTRMTFISLFANRMFEWSEPEGFNTSWCLSPRIVPGENKHSPMKIPTCLELFAVCCCFRPKWFR